MTRALFLLTHDERVRRQYVEGLRERFPDLDVEAVDHHSKAAALIGSTDILLTFGSMMADHVASAARNLKWVQALGTGTDGIADLPSLRPEVIVTRAHGIHGAAMSEAVLAGMLALSRDIARSVRCQERRSWQRWPATLLHGKTVGILGMGAIAEALAPRCKAMGMTVVGLSAQPREVPGFDRVHPRSELRERVGEFDYFVVLVPLSAQTRLIVDAQVIAAMKPTSFLVNVARGGVLDEQGLAAALHDGAIAGAALDVFSEEPLPATSPLWALKNLMITSHMGGVHDRYVDDVMPLIEENMRRFLAGDIRGMKGLIERNTDVHERRQT